MSCDHELANELARCSRKNASYIAMTIMQAVIVIITINLNICIFSLFMNVTSLHFFVFFCKGLTAKEIDNLSADMFVMSPPCQPFTRYTVNDCN